MKELKANNYSIHFSDWEGLNQLCAKESYSRIVAIVDENTKRHCLPILKKNFGLSFEAIEIASGEQHKSLIGCQTIYKQMIDLGLDRNSLVLCLGGGVIGDMGGFCASTYMRGIDFIQLPTTLLSMVDSSVGSKLGVDFNGLKNIVGLFKDPKAVFVFKEFLATLPTKQLKSGLGEVFKYGLIEDQQLWNKLSELQISESQDWDQIIKRSLEIKMKITSEDPFEKGVRKKLNFGHTIGHALETLNLNSSTELLHGEAIAQGMIAELYLSSKKLGLSSQELEYATQNLVNFYSFENLPTTDLDDIYAICLKDKKNKNGKILASLLTAIGVCRVNIEIDKQDIQESLNYLKSSLQ